MFASWCPCFSSKDTLFINSPLSGQKLKLSPRDCQIIQNTWNSIDDKDEFGKAIFTEIFKQKPSLKSNFDLTNIPGISDTLFNKYSRSNK
jgi:hypothetical protein